LVALQRVVSINKQRVMIPITFKQLPPVWRETGHSENIILLLSICSLDQPEKARKHVLFLFHAVMSATDDIRGQFYSLLYTVPHNPLSKIMSRIKTFHSGNIYREPHEREHPAKTNFGKLLLPRLDSIAFGSVRFDSIQLSSIRCDSIQLGSIRLDSTRLDLTGMEWTKKKEPEYSNLNTQR